MDLDHAYELALKQRPGVKIVVGATEAREERISPIRDIHKLPGDSSWFERDVRELCSGKLPAPLTLFVGYLAEQVASRKLTRVEWEHLDSCTYIQRSDFLLNLLEGSSETTTKA